MKLKKVLSLVLAIGSLVTISNYFNSNVGAIFDVIRGNDLINSLNIKNNDKDSNDMIKLYNLILRKSLPPVRNGFIDPTLNASIKYIKEIVKVVNEDGTICKEKFLKKNFCKEDDIYSHCCMSCSKEGIWETTFMKDVCDKQKETLTPEKFTEWKEKYLKGVNDFSRRWNELDFEGWGENYLKDVADFFGIESCQVTSYHTRIFLDVCKNFLDYIQESINKLSSERRKKLDRFCSRIPVLAFYSVDNMKRERYDDNLECSVPLKKPRIN